MPDSRSNELTDDFFARVAISRKFMTLTHLREALASLRRNEHARLPDAAVALGYITREHAEAVERICRCGQVVLRYVDDFAILTKVGEGGMGAVYAAIDSKERELRAVKVLPKELARDEDLVRRFEREAQVAVKLRHENIVAGIRTGISEGFHFFAMEFVDGESVYELLRGPRSLPERQALQIARGVALGLQHASDNGLVHRDIKPENIMLDRAGDVPKLLDMGLVKKTDAGRDTRLTQSGMAIGTPHYISPEQARGEDTVDSRSDIYALGATLYHMLTGRVPFEGTTAAVIMTKHLTEQLPWPSEVNQEVSARASRLVSRMMAKSPDDRYPSPQAVVADIDLLLDGKEPSFAALPMGASAIRQAVEAPGNWLTDRLKAFVAERQVLAASLASAAVVLLIVLIALSISRAGKTPADAPPVEAAEISRTQAVDDFERRLDGIDPRRIPEIVGRAGDSDLLGGLSEAERRRIEAAVARAKERYERAATAELVAIIGEDEVSLDHDAELLARLVSLRNDFRQSRIVPKLDAMIAELAYAEELREAAYAEVDLLAGMSGETWRSYGDWSFGGGGARFRYDPERRYSNAVQSNAGFGEGTFVIKLSTRGGRRATIAAWDQGTQDVRPGAVPSGWIAELAADATGSHVVQIARNSDGVHATVDGEPVPVRARNADEPLGHGRLTVALAGGEWRIEELKFRPANPAGEVIYRAALHADWRGPEPSPDGASVTAGTAGGGQGFTLPRSGKLFALLRSEDAERLAFRVRIDGVDYHLQLSGIPIATRWHALALSIEDFRSDGGSRPPELGVATDVEIIASGEVVRLSLRSVEFNARSR